MFLLFFYKIMQKTVIFLLAVFLILEIYVYQAFKTVYSSQNGKLIYWIPTILVYGFLFYSIFTYDRGSHKYLSFQVVFSVILIFVLPKLLIAIFLLIEDIIRLLSFGYNYVATDNHVYPSRRKFISLVGLGSGAILAGMVLDGIVFGKYRHKARIVRLKLKNLPSNFKGYKIVQISDVHSGSFQNPKNLQHAIDLINKHNADLVLFTGDMVNNYADEFVPFINLFSQIKGKDGKFAVLGNHDYGEYGVWVRPLSMFMEEVDRVKYPEAAQRYRFERIAAGPWENSKQQEIRTTRTTHVVNEGVRRSKMSDAATHSWDIPQEEPELHPLVAEFLDQETTEGRLEVLQRMSGKVDKRDLDSLCFCLDMNPVGGSVEEELDAIRQCIRMQQRYDAPRLRYGK